MLNEAFIRDFFGMKPAEKPTAKPEPKPQPKVRTIEVNAADPLEVRAEKIVDYMEWSGGDRCWSIPQLSPAEATLRILKMLRKYEELDQAVKQAKQ